MSNKDNKQDTDDRVARWRLVLGKHAEAHGVSCDAGVSGRDYQRIEQLVGFLFEQSGGPFDPFDPQERERDRAGDLAPGHATTVPEWIDGVSELFPRSAKEVLEGELVRRRGLKELMQQPDLLERIEPNKELVKTLLTHRDLLNENTRVLARKIIDKVVRELKEKMKVAVEPALTGAIRRDRHSPRRVYRNLDLRTTVRRNMRNWDATRAKLLVDRVYFHAAERNTRPWHVIVAVDQSGSMLDSAIHSAVMASIFVELPAVRASLFLFDTEIADLSDRVSQPVDVLLNVQLGGGTDITRALQYAGQLVRQPARTIVVLVSDFHEGRDERDLIRQTRLLTESGVRMIGLGALGYDARPAYNKSTARKLRKVGMDVLVCTPEKLADVMGRIIRG